MGIESTSDRRELLEDVVERFEEAYRRGERPTIDDHLSAARNDEERRAWLVELVHADLECRLTVGDAVRAEEYFARYPELLDSDEVVLSILRAEFDLRSQHDRSVTWDELIARFPEYRKPLLAHSIVGRFRLLSRLGEGNFGIVWKAEDRELERIVAIKIPHPGRVATRKDMDRFLREARNVARLQHRSIVNVHEVGTHQGLPFLVSEYVTGESLSERLADAPLSYRESAELIAEAAEALDYAHSLGVVHRDIKPSNILLCRPASDASRRSRTELACQVKLADFGLSRRADVDPTLTRAGDILGTPAYMTPEHVRGDTLTVDARSDVYAMGVVLYQLLTGSVPFHGSASAIMHQHLHSEPARIRRIDPNVPRDLEAVCLKCLEKSPDRRYATAGTLAADLRRWLRNEPTLARPSGAPGRAAKWMRRRPAAAALCFLSIATVIGILCLNMWRVNQLGVALDQSDRLRVAAEGERKNAVQANDISRRLLYALRMRSAQHAWIKGDIHQVRDLINRYAEGSPDADLRHFEWYHLNYLCHVPHRELKGHVGEAYAVEYSPDGRFLLTGGQDGTVRIWDATTGNPLAVLKEHTSCVNVIDFAPDGDTFVTASCDRTIKLWSLKSRELLRTIESEMRSVSHCAFLDGGKLLIATCGRLDPNMPGEARLWDVATWTARTDWPPQEEKDTYWWFSWQRSGNTLVSNSQGRLTVWNRDGESWRAERQFHLGTKDLGYLSPDAEFLLAPAWPNYMRTFQVRDGKMVSLSDVHRSQISSVSFSPSGRRVATTSDSLRVWDYPFGILQFRFLTPVGCWHTAWNKSEDQIVGAYEDGVVRIWELRLGKPRLDLPSPSESGPLVGFAYWPDDDHVSATYANQRLTWNRTSGQLIPADQISRLPPGPEDQQFAISANSDDGRRIACIADGQVAIRDVATGEETLRLDIGTGDHKFRFAPDGTALVADNHFDGGLYYWPGKR